MWQSAADQSNQENESMCGWNIRRFPCKWRRARAQSTMIARAHGWWSGVQPQQRTGENRCHVSVSMLLSNGGRHCYLLDAMTSYSAFYDGIGPTTALTVWSVTDWAVFIFNSPHTFYWRRAGWLLSINEIRFGWAPLYLGLAVGENLSNLMVKVLLGAALFCSQKNHQQRDIAHMLRPGNSKSWEFVCVFCTCTGDTRSIRTHLDRQSYAEFMRLAGIFSA